MVRVFEGFISFCPFDEKLQVQKGGRADALKAATLVPHDPNVKLDFTRVKTL
jgi:hypothetical protein